MALTVVGVYVGSLFCHVVIGVLSSLAIIFFFQERERERERERELELVTLL